MKTKKVAKSALFTSVLALVLCVSMLVGTTFAWFTDSVASKNNIIKAGNLDVELYNSTEINDGAKVGSETTLFDQVKLWEPGAVAYENLTVANVGSLALKYQLSVNFGNATSVPGTDKTLADVLKVAVVPGGVTSDDRDAVVASVDGTSASWQELKSFQKENRLYPAGDAAGTSSETFAVVIYWEPGENDNDYNMNNANQGKVLSVDLGVHLYATQLVHEDDSFGPDYDADAPKMYTVNGTAYDTAEEALENAEEGDEVYLSTVNKPIVIDVPMTLTISNTNIVAGAGINAITVNADATIIAEGYNAVTGGDKADGIYVAEGVNLTLSGSGRLIAKGNGGIETAAPYNSKDGGSGIDVNGTILIENMASLTAEGYGNHAFGIGGSTESIQIINSTVDYAKGGRVKAAIEDNNYGKSEPEGGAAIGSSVDGAVIEIKNSTITRADGGSKAAGIGAQYHTGVTVNIENSNVTAYGGNASAGIGGSRVTKHESAEAQAINVNITGSTVKAVGGDFAAGIGSGYNTYCASVMPVTTVNIDAASTITAQGGLLGAGVGTGHNCMPFTGTIACDTTNIKAGSSEDPAWCCWGNPCTEAQDIGLGVFSINNFVGKDTPVAVVSTADQLVGALESGKDVIMANDIKIDPATMSNAYGKTGINIKNGQSFDGNGHTLDIKDAGDNWDSGVNTTGGEIRNLTVTGSFRGVFINHNSNYSEPVVLHNVVIDGTTYTISCDQGLNQTLEVYGSTFKGWTSYAATVGSASFTDCYFGYGNGYSFLRPFAPTEFIGCEFEAGFEMDPRAAVTFENCTLDGVALTAENLATLVTANITNATVK